MAASYLPPAIQNHSRMVQNTIDKIAIRGETSIVPILDVRSGYLVSPLIGAFARAACFIVTPVREQFVPDTTVGGLPHANVRVGRPSMGGHCADPVLPRNFWILSILPEPAEHGAQAACSLTMCASTDGPKQVQRRKRMIACRQNFQFARPDVEPVDPDRTFEAEHGFGDGRILESGQQQWPPGCSC